MDEEGTIINEWERDRQRKGNVRTLRVYLDAAQYQADVTAVSSSFYRSSSYHSYYLLS
jgi:hypothetical protein